MSDDKDGLVNKLYWTRRIVIRGDSPDGRKTLFEIRDVRVLNAQIKDDAETLEILTEDRYE